MYAVKPILAALAFTFYAVAIRIAVTFTQLNARFILYGALIDANGLCLRGSGNH